jgi:hypothetical protein
MTFALLLDHKTLSFGWKQLALAMHKHLYRRSK